MVWLAKGAKNIFLPCLSPLQVWGSLGKAFTGKFVYMAHHFILLQPNPFDLSVDREGWWFEHSVSKLGVYLLLRGWDSLTTVALAFTGKF